jgi:hypothetical protein
VEPRRGLLDFGDWRRRAQGLPWYPPVGGVRVSTDGWQTRAEVAVSQVDRLFRPILGGHFMARWGPAWNEKERGCQTKLCFVATDRALLADVLGQLAERPDGAFVKYSVHPRDGMYLGRCFLKDEHEVGVLWAEYHGHPRLFCSVQDDDFTAPFRPPG